jgi:hypothetical protein
MQREAMEGQGAERKTRLNGMQSQVKQNLAGETDFGGDEAETTATAAPQGRAANE